MRATQIIIMFSIQQICNAIYVRQLSQTAMSVIIIHNAKLAILLIIIICLLLVGHVHSAVAQICSLILLMFRIHVCPVI